MHQVIAQNAEVVRVFRLPEVQDRLKTLGLDPVLSSPAELARYQATDPAVLMAAAGDATTFRARILKARSGAGLHVLEGVIEDASILTSTVATTTTGYTDSSVVAAALASKEGGTSPMLRDLSRIKDQSGDLAVRSDAVNAGIRLPLNNHL